MFLSNGNIKFLIYFSVILFFAKTFPFIFFTYILYYNSVGCH